MTSELNKIIWELLFLLDMLINMNYIYINIFCGLGCPRSVKSQEPVLGFLLLWESFQTISFIVF